jgi:hypothetical protein
MTFIGRDLLVEADDGEKKRYFDNRDVRFFTIEILAIRELVAAMCSRTATSFFCSTKPPPQERGGGLPAFMPEAHPDRAAGGGGLAVINPSFLGLAGRFFFRPVPAEKSFPDRLAA